MRTAMLVGVICVGCGDDGASAVADARKADATPDVASDCVGKTVFLNRAGGVYVKATPDNATTNSSYALDMTRTLAAYPYDNASWAAVKACVTQALAPFNATVTDVDPGTAQHHEIVFTTAYWAGSGVFSVSSATCASGTSFQSLPASGVAFLFANAFSATSGATRDQLICEAAVSQLATEVAGLDHVTDCRDYLDVTHQPCGAKMFVDAPLTCGEDTARACTCGGTTQNTYEAVKHV
jgi:hypothetical protein